MFDDLTVPCDELATTCPARIAAWVHKVDACVVEAAAA
jgi:hypothetical protein